MIRVLIFIILVSSLHLDSTSRIKFLAGFQVLRSSACVAELSWACGQVVHHVFMYQISPCLARLYLSPACVNIYVLCEVIIFFKRYKIC